MEPKSGTGFAQTGKGKRGGGNKKSGSDAHVNSPFRDVHMGGHDLNESYKIPSPNESGVNHSYMHPLDLGAAENSPGFPSPQGNHIAPLQTGKGGK